MALLISKPEVTSSGRTATLNKFPGIFVKVDGVPGPKTSEAFKKVTGHFLVGDPRAQNLGQAHLKISETEGKPPLNMEELSAE